MLGRRHEVERGQKSEIDRGLETKCCSKVELPLIQQHRMHHTYKSTIQVKNTCLSL